MFDGFSEHYLPTGRGTVCARVGGSGPPVLLLHGYPQTHLMWRAAAALLASRSTVVAADLPGYGASFRSTAAPDHAPPSKRALAVDLVQAMSAAGLPHRRRSRRVLRLPRPSARARRGPWALPGRGNDRLLVLWSTRGSLPRLYGDVLEVWRPWARQVTGQPMPTTHFVAEDQPGQAADVLTEFLDQHVTTPELI